MSVVVLGNCQARGFARCLNAIAGPLNPVVVQIRAIDRHTETIRAAEIVFCQPDSLGELETKVSGRLVMFPRIVTMELHPDCSCQPLQAQGAMGAHHSVLMAAAYAVGLSPERAERLFNRYMFARLGYFDIMRRHRRASLRQAAKYGYDLDEFFRAVSGAYMYSLNHPRIDLLYELALQAAKKAGLGIRKGKAPRDDLIDGLIWPVYPELAPPGIEGGYEFKPPQSDATMSLAEFIERSFQTFARAPQILEVEAIRRAAAVLRHELQRAQPSGALPDWTNQTSPALA